MSKYTFHKDPERKQSKEIKATEISEPETTFDLSSFSKEEISASDSGAKRIGRPAKNKVYSTIRIQKSNINRINAFQNTLDFETQDDIVSFMLDRLD
ncbi:Replication-associated protein RepC, partial [Enterococcus faecalis]